MITVHCKLNPEAAVSPVTIKVLRLEPRCHKLPSKPGGTSQCLFHGAELRRGRRFRPTDSGPRANGLGLATIRQDFVIEALPMLLLSQLVLLCATRRRLLLRCFCCYCGY